MFGGYTTWPFWHLVSMKSQMTTDSIYVALGTASGEGPSDFHIVKSSLKCSLPYPDFLPTTLSMMSAFLQVSLGL